ncbi:MAG TPA: dihydroorotate dehydrogenase-like protein [Candidatus Limnocylindrales bacterium]|nr:dihydroorotate dehydrogenase-like protein [Candidatus Limnocylindrales bacterium]
MTPDLRTRYLGLDLQSPIVASSTPLTGDPSFVKQLEEAGAGAVVLPSLFEEEILHDELEMTRALDQGTEQFAEALGYFPAVAEYKGVGDRYLERIEKTKKAVSIPVIASLNADASGAWTRYAKLMQDAGADALELNLYHVAADPEIGSSFREQADIDLVTEVANAITIPFAVKLSPYYAAFANFAGRVVGAGADGLVLFNRFYQPDLDLETFDVINKVSLSHPTELRLPLRWIGMLRPQLGPDTGLAATSGIHAATDVVKALAVGADVTMMASAILRHGAGHVGTVTRDLVDWMTEREYESVSQLRASATAANVPDASAFERANYLATLHSWSTPREVGV